MCTPISRERTLNRVLTYKHYELKHHLGNVRVLVSDARHPIYNGASALIDVKAKVEAYYNYFAFGMLMPGRVLNPGDSRIAYNGKEKDDEIYGSGNSYDFGARMYDPRLGRWMSVDKETKNYVPISPYVFALNKPIIFIDNDGNLVVDADGNAIVINENSKTGQLEFTLREGASDKAKQYFEEKTLPLLNTLNNSQVGRTLIQEIHADKAKILTGEDKNAAYKDGNSLVEEEDFGKKFKLDEDRYGFSFTIQGGHEHIKNATPEKKAELLIATLTVEYLHVKENTVVDYRTITDEELNKVYSGSLNEATRKIVAYRKEKGIPVDQSAFSAIETFNKDFIKDHTHDVKYDSDNQKSKDELK